MVKSRPALSVFIFVALAFLFFGRTLSNEFVYDDQWRIVKNPSIRVLHPISRFFLLRDSQSFSLDLNQDTYRPLQTLHFALDFRFFGLNPIGYHAENILFHGVNAALVMLLGISVFSLPVWVAALLGILFLFHPTSPESVAWIVGRSNVMSLFFLLTGLWIWSKPGRTTGTIIQTLGLYFAGLLYRESTLFMPVILFLHDVATSHEGTLRHRIIEPLKKLAPFAALGMAYFLFRLVLLGRSAQMDFWSGSRAWSLLSGVKMIVPYLRFVFLPNRLSVNYPPDPARSLIEANVLAGLFLIVVAMGGAFWFFQKKKTILLAFGFSFFMWIPVSNLFPLRTLLAVRFVYPVLPGLLWALGMGGCWAFTRWFGEKKGIRGLSFLLIIWGLVMSRATWQGLKNWETEVGLWTNAIQINPQDSFAWYCLGLAKEFDADFSRDSLDKKRNRDEAKAAYTAALARRHDLNQSFVVHVEEKLKAIETTDRP